MSANELAVWGTDLALTSWVIQTAAIVEVVVENRWRDEETMRLNLGVTNGYTLSLWDAGQSCCETRGISTDDDLNDLIGTRLVSLEVTEVKYKGDRDDCDCEDSAFMKLQSTRSCLTFVNYVHHNGYYGGWDLVVELRDPSGRVVAKTDLEVPD